MIAPAAVVRLVTLTAVASALSTSITPVAVSAEIVVPASSSGVVFPIPLAASRSMMLAVTNPTPLIALAELIVTRSPSAVVVPVSTISPVPVVRSVTSLPAPLAVTLVPTVRLAPAFVSSTSPSPVETTPNVTLPPPDWSNVTAPDPVVRLVTLTAVASALSISIAPVVVSAEIVVPASSSAVVFPIPLAASRSITLAVTSPAPLMLPAELITTSSPSAVVVPVSTTFAPPVVTSDTSPAPPATIEPPVPFTRSPASLVSVTLPAFVATVVNVTLPPPVWSNRTNPVPVVPPVVNVLTCTGDASALSTSMFPSAESIVSVDPASSSGVVFPIPVWASRSIPLPDTSPAPLIDRAESIVTWSVAVVVPVSTISPVPVVRSVTSLPAPLAVTLVPTVRLAPAFVSSTSPSPVETTPNVTLPPPDWSNVTAPDPVVRLVTLTAVASALSISIAPVVVSAEIVDPASSNCVVFPIPLAASRSITLAVTSPAPLIAPAELTVTWSPSAVVVPVSTTSPDPVVRSVTSLPALSAVTLVATVRSAPAFVSRTSPFPVDTTPNVTLPLPDWSNVTAPAVFVRLVTLTGVASALSISIAPVVVSAEIVDPASSNCVVFPIPVAASRSMTLAVTNPAPLMLPTELITTSSPSAVVVPVSTTSPLVLVVSVAFPAPPAVTLVPTTRFAPVFVSPMSPSNVDTTPKFTLPPPVWSNRIEPVSVPTAGAPVVSDVTVTAVAELLSTSIAPSSVSIVNVCPTSSSELASPIPVAASITITLAVTSTSASVSASLMLPSERSVAVPLVDTSLVPAKQRAAAILPITYPNVLRNVTSPVVLLSDTVPSTLFNCPSEIPVAACAPTFVAVMNPVSLCVIAPVTLVSRNVLPPVVRLIGALISRSPVSTQSVRSAPVVIPSTSGVKHRDAATLPTANPSASR